MKGMELEVMAVEVPSFLRCPISLELMKDPVTLCTGLTYDRRSIETWLDAGNTTCPVTNQFLQNLDLIPNHTLRRLIQDWCVANRSKGIQPIPTPKVPLSPRQVTKILSQISAGDRESIRKLRVLAKESDRNNKCIALSNAAFVLGSLFADHSPYAMNRVQNSVEMCEEALGMAAMMLPMNEQALEMFASSNAVACLVWILQKGNPEAKNSAVALLQEIVSKNKLYRERMGNVDGLAEGLVQLLREPICPAATKASITTIYHISLKRSFRVNAVEAGAVPLLLEILVGADRVICERALLALDILCNCTEGRAAAYGHALAVPVVVKKILRVSDLASEVAVLVLWNLCHNSSDGDATMEAVQVGAFQKVLVVVQVGCGERTRDKATMLLKLFNGYTADCDVESLMSFSNESCTIVE